MTDKMPDEKWLEGVRHGAGCAYEISEQDCDAKIAALRAEHRAEMLRLCDELGKVEDEAIELIKQRISDERI